METKAELPGQKIGNDPIVELLCHRDSSHVLVQASASLHVICLASCEVTHSRKQPYTALQQWITHPHNTSLIVGFGIDSILVLDWNLEERQRYSYEGPSRVPAGLGKGGMENRGDRLEQVLVARDGKRVLVKTSYSEGSGEETSLVYFQTSSFTPTAATTTETETPIKPTPLPPDLTRQVSRVLSFQSNDRLVFLSRDYSVCSWQLRTNLIKELFSLPGDWINRDCLALCSVWDKERAFLCPRNGEVAVVKCAALA